MNHSRLALIPAFWLALSGAAVPQQSSAVRALAECKLGMKEAFAAIGTLQVTSTNEAEDGPRHRIIRHYTLPAGLSLFGFPVEALGSLETIEDGKSRTMMIATVTGDYSKVHAAGLAAHGAQACRGGGDRGYDSCSVPVAQADGGWKSLLIADNEGKTDIACTYEASK